MLQSRETQRAWSPDPQARGSLSLWTGAWPTQPAITQAVNRRGERERVVTNQATYTLAGPPELRWGNLKGMSA
jgi:hypothetical protein